MNRSLSPLCCVLAPFIVVGRASSEDSRRNGRRDERAVTSACASFPVGPYVERLTCLGDER